MAQESAPGRRARDLGISFKGEPGPLNAITDVAGVEVGAFTLVQGDDVRTGVTAVHPRGRKGAGDPVAAGFHSQNGNGEMTGTEWIQESGTFSGPVALTSTHAVGVAHAAIVSWTVQRHPEAASSWLLPVVAETYDGYLHDVNGRHLTEAMVHRALDDAQGGPVAEGSVGGGTGMTCYQYKGGSGTASRRLSAPGGSCTVGVFVQANFGLRRDLTVAGRRLGELLADDNPMAGRPAVRPGAGSVIALVATDAPLLPLQLQAMARRVPLGLARTGTTGSHFSGDLALAFSVANPGAITPPHRFIGRAEPFHMDRLEFVPWGYMDPLYEAVVQATEEAVLNALVAGGEMTGKGGRRVPGFPLARVAELFREPPRP